MIVAHADDNLVLAQRLGEWISNAPELELDIALGNIGLDHLGVARALYTRTGEMEGRTEDDYAMFRDERQFTNLLLVEMPNGDFASTIVRQFLFDAYQLQLWADLAESSDDEVVAGIAAKALKEASYHLRFSSGWLVRLGDGTEESHTRAQNALDSLWQFTDEMFETPETAGYRPTWDALVARTVDEATLILPTDPYQRSGGRQGLHTEHLGLLLAEMQSLARSHPGVTW